MKKTILYSCIIIVINGCRVIQFTPGEIAEKQLAIPESVTVKTSLTASVTGNLRLEGALLGESCKMDSSTEINEAKTISHAQSGVEGMLSCGEDWVKSQYMALAGFAPHYDNEKAVDGFAIFVTTTAQNGLWFSKQKNDCIVLHHEKSLTYVKATGKAQINYQADAGIKDLLLIRVNSDTSVSLSVTDADGKPITVQENSIGKLVELPHSGLYEITASMVGIAVGESDCKNCLMESNSTAVITFQSLREALKATGSDSLYQIPLQVFLPITAIQNKLNERLFTKQKRFYPCTPSSACGKDEKHVYFKNPSLKINGDALSLSIEIKKTKGIFSAKPGIKGSILLTATMAVENDILFLKNIALEPSSTQFLTEHFSLPFTELLVTQLHMSIYYNYITQLTEAYAKLLYQFPLNWNTLSLMPDLNSISLKQFYPVLQPEPGIVFDYAGKTEVKKEDALGTEEEK